MNQEKYRNKNKKKARIRDPKIEKLQPSRSVQSHDHLNNIKMSNILDVRIQGRQKRPSECVCVKRKVLVHNNINNENMKTEMKDNKIINVKNKI